MKPLCRTWFLLLPWTLLAACGGGDPSAPTPVAPAPDPDPPTDPPPPGVMAAALVQPLPASVTSRRFDLQVAVADSGHGVAHVEVWARPSGVDWELALTVSDTLPVRFTVPEAGPFGPWEFAALAVAPDGAREAQPEAAQATTIVPEPIIIFDRQDEAWEITHAVLHYGMGEHAWEFGLGRWTIQALVDPMMSCPGDPDYPHPDNLSVVFGVHLADEARAYKLGDLNDREVVDDSIGGIPFAVTY